MSIDLGECFTLVLQQGADKKLSVEGRDVKQLCKAIHTNLEPITHLNFFRLTI